MERLTSRDSIPDSESDFPPVLLCARCGRSSCAGCGAESEIVPAPSEIAFEGTVSMRSFWQTVLSCSTEPEAFFGRRLIGVGFGRALLFATLCEMLALGSVFLLLGLGLAALLPGAFAVLLSPGALAVGSLLWIGSIGFMVGAHALGGAAFLLGAGARPPGSLHLVLRFGFYSCGWDLLTSPVGVVLVGLFGQGPPRFAPLWKAARAPRPAIHALLSEAFGLSREEQERRLRRLTRTALAWLCLAILTVGSFASLWLAQSGILFGLQWG